MTKPRALPLRAQWEVEEATTRIKAAITLITTAREYIQKNPVLAERHITDAIVNLINGEYALYRAKHPE